MSTLLVDGSHFWLALAAIEPATLGEWLHRDVPQATYSWCVQRSLGRPFGSSTDACAPVVAIRAALQELVIRDGPRGKFLFSADVTKTVQKGFRNFRE